MSKKHFHVSIFSKFLILLTFFLRRFYVRKLFRFFLLQSVWTQLLWIYDLCKQQQFHRLLGQLFNVLKKNNYIFLAYINNFIAIIYIETTPHYYLGFESWACVSILFIMRYYGNWKLHSGFFFLFAFSCCHYSKILNTIINNYSFKY